jgi:voltage-gated potassium channel
MITFKNVIVEKKDDLILTFLLGIFVLFIASSLMFQFEHDSQPENFTNIFDALYWGIIPLTTVGYGDIYPQTGEGKLISAVITLICITMVALPTGILSSGFIEEMKKSKECELKDPEIIKCPHCQKDIDLKKD